MNKRKILPLSRNKIMDVVKRALEEDKAFNDITTRAVISPQTKAKCRIVFKENGVLCGLDFAREAFLAVDKKISFKRLKEDGDFIKKNEAAAEIEGSAQALLNAERTALNFLGHLCGIAYLTRKFVAAASPQNIQITDTRKTLPLLREIEKYAVRTGGGISHRKNLAKQFLIKDNHLDILKKSGQNKSPIAEAVERARAKNKNRKKIEIEVQNLKEFEEALKLTPDIIMLDNMKAKDIKEALLQRDKKSPHVKIEVSGKMNLSKIKKIAGLNIDYISVGRLTHSAKSIDIGLEFCV